MPFVKRDDDGNVVGFFSCRQYEGQEYLPEDAPEIVSMNEKRMAAKENQEIKRRLLEIDVSSIRAIREWIAALPMDSPVASQKLTEKENMAKEERAKLK